MYQQNYTDYEINYFKKPDEFKNTIKNYFSDLRQNAIIKKQDKIKVEEIQKEVINEQIIEQKKLFLLSVAKQKNEEVKEEIYEPIKNSIYNMSIIQLSSIAIFSYIIYKIIFL